jgi:hypothetical protein
MLRVYLDQNKWIDLARTAIGHRRMSNFWPVASDPANAKDLRGRRPGATMVKPLRMRRSGQRRPHVRRAGTAGWSRR